MRPWIFLDIETLGLNEQVHPILELAMVHVDPQTLNPLASKSWVIKLIPNDLVYADVTALKMHSTNGLLAEAIISPLYRYHTEEETVEFIKDNCTEEPTLCGNSVHFDRKFLRRWMPELESKFHHRHLDVSSIRVMMDAWSEVRDPHKEQSNHRALSDCHASIQELKCARNILFGQK